MGSLCFDRDSQKCSSTGIWDTVCWFQPCPFLYVIPHNILTPQLHYKARTPKELGQMFQSIAVVDRLPGQQWLRLSAVAAASTNPWVTTRELAIVGDSATAGWQRNYINKKQLNLQGVFFDWSALKMTKCQTLRKFWHLELFWSNLHVIWH